LKHILSYLNTDRFRRLAKEGGWVVVGQVASVLGALVLVRVLTEYLDPSQYGELALGLTIAGLINQVVMGGVIAGITRYYSVAVERGDVPGYLKDSRRLLGYAVLTVGLVAVILITGLIWFDQYQWTGLAFAVVIFSVLSGCNSTLNGVQNAARQRSVVALHSGLEAWLKIGMTICVVLWLGVTSTIVVIGYVLSALCITASQLYFLKQLTKKQHHEPHDQYDNNWLHRIWLYSWPFSAWGIFTWCQQASDRWALQFYATTQDVGHYAVVFQLGYAPIGLLTGMMMLLLGPIFYQRAGDATDHARNASVHNMAWRITGVCLSITGIAFILAFVLHGWLFQYLVASAYRSSSYLLPWVVLAGGIFAAGQILALKLMSEMKSSAMIMAKIVTAIFGVGFNVLGAKYFGIDGVVTSLVIFSVFYFVWMLWIARLIPNNKINTSITT
jgi:O-antigen/teichoic acid export membrane protein